ncbi:xyloglucan:xyloglucosyl transferase [Marchantia polymorpha subsp. ruderalis]|uniref:Xyloglucan endotransglucosylase/hydrolase n=2 Tax=Marchantia polymorpha TaxID=3197 RepID=A0A176VK34_MARPO|nr:hypothetical protein AXG93_4888s1130 [Marchantia polymorpha subsp. ruderalis]PTQ32872.1 hypothetical protein MARPO_0094s0046 [Marchantia polymorpha]BBN02746.1 hypothetical protein Mp_2g17780 [Marchantia polymorpha subsp. ruderalis]|eukprot:PTQ32872.1 hypothetical protein MARPO_0094s0046 [Marchantia polymorpha]
MMKMNSGSLSVLFAAIMLLGSCLSVSASFSDNFSIVWSQQNVVVDDASSNVQLSLTPDAGAQFQSKQSYLYGSFSVKLKLVPGDSAGTVASYYLTSYGDNHDEIDFEFLGNETGQPYVMHTNLFANGVGGREQRLFLWFDPTEDFHTYSAVWNHHQIIWLVDNTPIRIYKNIEATYPNSYPSSQPMNIAASIYEASSWATRGGAVPINWNSAPFRVNFQNFSFEGCEANGDISSCTENYTGNWWEGSPYQELTQSQLNQLKQFYQSYMLYDYCTDQARYPTPPTECSYNGV